MPFSHHVSLVTFIKKKKKNLTTLQTAQALQKRSHLEEDFPTHVTPGEAGLCFSDPSLSKPSWRLLQAPGSTAGAGSPLPRPPGTELRRTFL